MVLYRRFEITYWSRLQGSVLDSLTLEDRPIGSPETSVSNDLPPHNNTQDETLQFNRGESLRSHEYLCICRELESGCP
jgi:hypothetical protein